MRTTYFGFKFNILSSEIAGQLNVNKHFTLIKKNTDASGSWFQLRMRNPPNSGDHMRELILELTVWGGEYEIRKKKLMFGLTRELNIWWNV